MRFAYPADHDVTAMHALRTDILASPVTVALHRAEVYTRVFAANEGAPWIVTKALAFAEHLATVPLYCRDHDRLVGSITEIPGGMPVNVEIGIGENGIYTSENPDRAGYLAGQVPEAMVAYWEDRNLWGRHRAYLRTVHGRQVGRTQVAQYKFLSYQGHLSPSYAELLEVGLGGLIERVRQRRVGEVDPDRLEFLTAAEISLAGVSRWIERYAGLLADLAGQVSDPARAETLVTMADNCRLVALAPPETFWQALQLIWLVHQAVHIEGHGYSNTPDRIDQLLLPYYQRDLAAGRLTVDQALTLCENFLLKQRDNTVWGVEHNLTQGLCLGGSTPAGEDQTNALSWLFLRAADQMSLPEPLVWVRWHPTIDPDFFDACLETLAGETCFPLWMSDTAVPAMLQRLGASEADAFNYVAAGCNELAVPGMAYFNPCAYVGYLAALEAALTGGRGYAGTRPADPRLPDPTDLTSFEALTAAVGRALAAQLRASYADGVGVLAAQMRWGQTPFTSCFFDGCVDRGQDMIAGTRYNILSCGGTAFANLVDCLAAIREVVYDRSEATLAEVAAACAADFVGHEALRARLLAAPKQGNDDPRLRDLVALVERLRDEPLREICRDPRDGTPFGNAHVVRSSAVLVGRQTGATPDGRRAGAPLASSVAAADGCERTGPTALLNSVLALCPTSSWQCGYNVNIRFQRDLLADPAGRAKVGALLSAYFAAGGQELQVNAVDPAVLLAAQERPEEHANLVVRVAGFSEYFTRLHPDIQAELIRRTAHT